MPRPKPDDHVSLIAKRGRVPSARSNQELSLALGNDQKVPTLSTQEISLGDGQSDAVLQLQAKFFGITAGQCTILRAVSELGAVDGVPSRALADALKIDIPW
jgi:hypothetical protein